MNTTRTDEQHHSYNRNLNQRCTILTSSHLWEFAYANRDVRIESSVWITCRRNLVLAHQPMTEPERTTINSICVYALLNKWSLRDPDKRKKPGRQSRSPFVSLYTEIQWKKRFSLRRLLLKTNLICRRNNICLWLYCVSALQSSICVQDIGHLLPLGFVLNWCLRMNLIV